METHKISNQEILAIALKIEKEGKQFYAHLAKSVSNSKVRKFAQLMVEEETKHEKQFKKLLRDKKAKTYGWEKQKAVKEMVETCFQTDIFPPVKSVLEELPRLEGIQKALEFAADSERTSAEFYGILGQHCEDFDAKTALVLLEKAEIDHLARIEDLRMQFLQD